MDYTISKVQHGYVIIEGGHYRDRGSIVMMWAYSTLKEVLSGLNELYTEPVVVKK